MINIGLVIISPQLFKATDWQQNESFTSDHTANSSNKISPFQKAPRTHIPPRSITEKANWEVFAGKLRNYPYSEPDPSILWSSNAITTS